MHNSVITKHTSIIHSLVRGYKKQWYLIDIEYTKIARLNGVKLHSNWGTQIIERSLTRFLYRSNVRYHFTTRCHSFALHVRQDKLGRHRRCTCLSKMAIQKHSKICPSVFLQSFHRSPKWSSEWEPPSTDTLQSVPMQWAQREIWEIFSFCSTKEKEKNVTKVVRNFTESIKMFWMLLKLHVKMHFAN